MHATSKKARIRFYSEDIGAIAVELDGEWIEVPSVFERYRGERAQTWILAAQDIRASVAAQKKVDEEAVFKAMTRIREINANALARQRLLVDDYSKERLAELEDSLLIGFEVDETPREAQMPPTEDGLGLELQTAQTRVAQAAGAGTTVDTLPAQASEVPDGRSSRPAVDDADENWSFGDK